MTECFGTRFTSQYGDKPSDVWARGLAGLSGQQIADGMHRVVDRGFAWPPSMGEFKRICMEVDGVPSAEEALVIACRLGSGRGRWEHPVVYWAAADRRIDLFRLRQQPHELALRKWEPVYAEYLSRMADGEFFDWPGALPALEDKTGKPVTDEERAESRKLGSRALSKILGILKGVNA